MATLGVLMSVSVLDIMTRDPVSAEPDTPVSEAMALLEDARARHLPVVEGGRLVGMISDRDMREYRLPMSEALWQPDQVRRLLATPIADLMTREVVFVDSETLVEEAAREILDNGVGAVPVVEPGTEKLVGILSYVDVLEFYVPR